MIVIDASALAKYLLREEGWTSIEEYLVEGVYSVDLVVKEVANAIWKHVVVRKSIPVDLGLQIYRQLRRLVDEDVVILEGQEAYISRAVEVALHHGITVYDSLYIVQALRRGELLTSDGRQAEVARSLGVTTYYVR